MTLTIDETTHKRDERATLVRSHLELLSSSRSHHVHDLSERESLPGSVLATLETRARATTIEHFPLLLPVFDLCLGTVRFLRRKSFIGGSAVK